MPRSEIRENQVKDDEFLSPYEHNNEVNHYFINEVDTPTTFSGSAGKYVRVSSAADALIFSVYEESWIEVTSDYNAISGDNMILDSTVSGLSVTLPSSPSLGDKVKFIDGPGNCATYPVTVSGAGEKILGSTNPLSRDEDDAYFALVYYNSTYGWKLGV